MSTPVRRNPSTGNGMMYFTASSHTPKHFQKYSSNTPLSKSVSASTRKMMSADVVRIDTPTSTESRKSQSDYFGSIDSHQMDMKQEHKMAFMGSSSSPSLRKSWYPGHEGLDKSVPVEASLNQERYQPPQATEEEEEEFINEDFDSLLNQLELEKSGAFEHPSRLSQQDQHDMYPLESMPIAPAAESQVGHARLPSNQPFHDDHHDDNHDKMFDSSFDIQDNFSAFDKSLPADHFHETEMNETGMPDIQPLSEDHFLETRKSEDLGLNQENNSHHQSIELNDEELHDLDNFDVDDGVEFEQKPAKTVRIEEHVEEFTRLDGLTDLDLSDDEKEKDPHGEELTPYTSRQVDYFVTPFERHDFLMPPSTSSPKTPATGYSFKSWGSPESADVFKTPSHHNVKPMKTLPPRDLFQQEDPNKKMDDKLASSSQLKPSSIELEPSETNLSPEQVKTLQDECLGLRALNERLNAANDMYKQEMSDLMARRDSDMAELKQSYEKRIDLIQRTEHAAQSTLEQKIKSLEKELTQAKADQSQISSLRSTLEKEKELDVLTIKKELLSQKERQLEDIRQQVAVEKDELYRRLKEENTRQSSLLHEDIERLHAEVARYKKLLSRRDEDIQELDQKLEMATTQLRSKVLSAPILVDAQLQCGESLEDVEAKQENTSKFITALQGDLSRREADIRVILSKLGRLILNDDLSENLSRSTCGSRIAKLLDSCESFVAEQRKLMDQARLDVSTVVEENKKLKMDIEKTEKEYQENVKRMNADMGYRTQNVRFDLEEQHRKVMMEQRESHIKEMTLVKKSFEDTLQDLRNEFIQERKKHDGIVQDLEMQMQRIKAESAAALAMASAVNEPSRAPIFASTSSVDTLKYPNMTLEQIQNAYPHQMEELRRLMRKETDLRIESLKQQHASDMKQIQNSYEERYRTSKREFSEITSQYQKTLVQFKEEGVKIQEKMKAEMERQLTDIQAKHRRELERMQMQSTLTHQDRSNRASLFSSSLYAGNNEEHERLRSKCQQFEKMTTELQTCLSQKSREWDEMRADFEQRLNDKQGVIQRLKKEYIHTLEEMKKDVSAMRKRHQERLEIEIDKRRLIEDEWKQKFMRVVSHYQTEVQQALMNVPQKSKSNNRSPSRSPTRQKSSHGREKTRSVSPGKKSVTKTKSSHRRNH